jgi:creatinine amidohydrolase
MSLYWEEHSWTDLQNHKPQVVLLPIGSVEAHGPHLPLATDTIISGEIARRSALELQQKGIYTLILPPLQYAVTDFSRDFPGTVTIKKESFQNILKDIAFALRDQGIPVICVVNSHLEPAHILAIHEAVGNIEGIRVLFPDKTKKPWASLLTPEFKQGACHAGCYETSLILAVREELVRSERSNLKPNPVNLAILMKQGVNSFKDAGAPEAYFGDPAAATSEEGEQTYQILTRMVVETVLESMRGSN